MQKAAQRAQLRRSKVAVFEICSRLRCDYLGDVLACALQSSLCLVEAITYSIIAGGSGGGASASHNLSEYRTCTK
jgi:hypothetical protein